MLRIACSGKSLPSATEIAQYINNETEETARLVRWTQPHTDVNWGRYRANSTLNPDISNTTNKRIMRELFAENNVPMPKLVTVEEMQEQWKRDSVDPDKTLNWTKYIGRPDKHTKGRGLWLVNGYMSLGKALRGTRKKKPATHFMEFIEAPREFRVHVFLGKSIRISEKSFTDDTKKEYTTAKPQHRVWHVRKAAKKAVEAVGLDFGTVDILATDRECWVLEVNSAAGLGGTMPKLWADTFLSWQRGEWDD